MENTLSATPFNPSQLAGLLTPLRNSAHARIRNPALAEDAVSEALLAALEARTQFQSPEQAQAWLYGVLRHKLVDQLRRQGREVAMGHPSLDDEAAVGPWNGVGAWPGDSGALHTPEQICEGRQLADTVSQCCDALPRMQRDAFVLRELQGMDPADVCARLAVTEGHLHVLVHRARQRLRQALASPVGRRIAGASGARQARALAR